MDDFKSYLSIDVGKTYFNVSFYFWVFMNGFVKKRRKREKTSNFHSEELGGAAFSSSSSNPLDDFASLHPKTVFCANLI